MRELAAFVSVWCRQVLQLLKGRLTPQVQLFRIILDGFLDEDRADTSCQTGDWRLGGEVGSRKGEAHLGTSEDHTV